jgi:predicted acylesterase/phospholipase RssA
MPDRTSILTNYKSDRWPRDLLDSVKIWEAARATSAASTFFESIKLGPDDEIFLDGATGANNPVNVVWDEARDIWKSNKPFEDKVHCLVSIGTGCPPINAFGYGLKDIGESLKSMATETETTANNFMRRFTQLHTQRRYFRFNVRSGLENIGLEEAARRHEIVAATRRYLTTEEDKKQLENCAEMLRRRECMVDFA